MRKAALHNLGCKVNAYETEAMQEMLEQNGYEIVPFAEGADVYVINTCTVTNMADRKSRQMLHRARKMNPNAVVVARVVMCRRRARKRMTVLISSSVIIKRKISSQILDEHLLKIRKKKNHKVRVELTLHIS